MAEQGQEDKNREDLSDEPSQHRIEEMRNKGQVSQSRELSGLLALMAAGTALYVTSPSIGGELSEFMRLVFRADLSARLNFGDDSALWQTIGRCAKLLALLSAPIMAAALVGGVFGSFAQIGPIFSSEPLQPDLNKINPVSGFQRYFTMRQLLDGIRLVVRASIVAFVAYLLVRPMIAGSARLILSDPNGLPSAFGRASNVVFWSLCAVLVVFAALDLWIQRWEFSKRVRLTKQEQKQETKEHEGDPLIKARVRSIQREIARRRMMNEVKKADVIVTNPTHIAVALRYDQTEMKAPKVVAKGADFLAQKIKKLAAEAGIPVVENPPLARTLYKVCKIGGVVPRALYQAVAEVLAYVYRLRKKG